ncbi:hypothetical protein DFP72DRAFT_478688 [Ephemerocybe angulata]|uniref:Uncharacterized protein n=1 Tax=Ephemerocybe angulata TaxID=980116 RepID=A0A8H6IDN7_9AGAR|nr:hypothetical protein DFP72DRAFT_478688 [Tulosesus angulatus]
MSRIGSPDGSSCPPFLPPRHRSRYRARIHHYPQTINVGTGESEQEMTGITRGSARKPGKLTARPIRKVPGARREVVFVRVPRRRVDRHKPARPSTVDSLGLASRRNRYVAVIVSSDYSGASENLESRVEALNGWLSRGEHRAGAHGMAAPSSERLWTVGGTDGRGVRTGDDVV